jgi:hypothetical protein
VLYLLAARGGIAVDQESFSSGYPFEDIYGYARAVRVGDHVFVSGNDGPPSATMTPTSR